MGRWLRASHPWISRRRTLTRLRVLHEGVAKQMADGHVGVLDPPVMWRVDDDNDIRQFGEFPSLSADQRDGAQAILARPLHAAHDVRRTATDAHDQNQIPRF